MTISMEIIQTCDWEAALWLKQNTGGTIYFTKTVAFSPEMIYNHIM